MVYKGQKQRNAEKVKREEKTPGGVLGKKLKEGQNDQIKNIEKER